MHHLRSLALVGGLPDAWFAGPILPHEVARDDARRWVDAQLVPHPVPEGAACGRRLGSEAVHHPRGAARRHGLDAWPPSWPLAVRVKVSSRDGYTIEKLT